jgi:hypothetical protein
MIEEIEVTKKKRKLHDKKHLNLYSSRNIVKVITGKNKMGGKCRGLRGSECMERFDWKHPREETT